MKIRDVKTNKIVELEMIDDRNNVDWIKDYVGNAGGFGKVKDGLIEYDSENDVYLADTDTINWWVDIIERQNKLNSTLKLIADTYSKDIADQLVIDGADGDLESTIYGLEHVIQQFLS